jgi:regulatory protein
LKARALRHLARREHSRDELARKLAPYAESNEVLEGLLRELESRKQLSNERFAELRAHQLARKYGAARIRHDLKSKGIADELSGPAVAELNELEKAKQILARKYRQARRAREARALSSEPRLLLPDDLSGSTNRRRRVNALPSHTFFLTRNSVERR